MVNSPAPAFAPVIGSVWMPAPINSPLLSQVASHPGDAEAQPDGKRRQRPDTITNASEVEHDTDPCSTSCRR